MTPHVPLDRNVDFRPPVSHGNDALARIERTPTDRGRAAVDTGVGAVPIATTTIINALLDLSYSPHLQSPLFADNKADLARVIL